MQVSLAPGGRADMRGAAVRAAAEARGPSEDEEPANAVAGSSLPAGLPCSCNLMCGDIQKHV